MTSAVLINNYNNADFIDECVNSALEQTRKVDEIIVYDDGSTDGSREKLRKFGASIQLIENDIRGDRYNVNQARGVSKAFEASSADYIFLLDGDDAFFRNKVETYLQAFDDGVDMIQSPVELVDEFSKSRGIERCEKAHVPDICSDIFSTHQVNQHYMTSCLAFRRSFIEKAFPIDLTRFKYVWTDSYLSVYSFARGDAITLEDPFTYYRKHSNSHSSLWHSRKYRTLLNLERIKLFNALSKKKISRTQFLLKRLKFQMMLSMNRGKSS